MSLRRLASLSLPRLALLPAFLLLGCPSADEPDPETPSMGLPEGESSWSGVGEMTSGSFLVEVELTNTDGDLEARVTVSDDPEAPLGFGQGVYTAIGTHAPASGAFAMAPVGWEVAPAVDIELLGATAVYDPDAGTLTGQLRDWASGIDNTLQGGDLSLTLDSGEGDPTPVGDEGQSLAVGTSTFAGTMQCSGAVRDTEGTLSYDGEGGVTGSLTVGDPGVDTPLGSFPFDGVHNPTTGTITIAPQPWDEPAPAPVNFMISGTYDAGAGTWTGDQLTNVAACPPATWDVAVTGP